VAQVSPAVARLDDVAATALSPGNAHLGQKSWCSKSLSDCSKRLLNEEKCHGAYSRAFEEFGGRTLVARLQAQKPVRDHRYAEFIVHGGSKKIKIWRKAAHLDHGNDCISPSRRMMDFLGVKACSGGCRLFA